MSSNEGELDLYEVLGISRDASKAEIKKAYHKAALSSHPDKVSEDERAAADEKFKNVSRAYEILFDEDTRHLYDTHGMQAFEHGRAPNASNVDLDDILAQMMGGMGGGVPPDFGGRRPNRPRRGRDEEQEYTVSLEDLYKGKTVRFTSTKDVLCSHCKGRGGKEKAKPRTCSSCQGQGVKKVPREVQMGLIALATEICGNCGGKGTLYNPKDRCKKCQGEGVTKTKKALELYIPKGSKDGEKIRLEGETDQVPDQEPGDLVFRLTQAEHDVFERTNNDLRAVIKVSLKEVLCGFSRTVIKHLDGRGIHIDHPNKGTQELWPGQVIKVKGEGMPIKKSEMKGDLYLVIDVDFPSYSWLEKNQALAKLADILPDTDNQIESEVVDEVDYVKASHEEAFTEETYAENDWEDENEDGIYGEQGEPQCQQQ